MRRILLLNSLLFFALTCFAQSLYFPPKLGNTWESTSPESLGWSIQAQEALIQFLDNSNTKAFIILKDGKIVIEHYFGSFTGDSIWQWNSAGKGISAVLAGIAQDEGMLNIDEKSSKYLGEGWTSLEQEQEDQITIKNQLSMSAGMNELFFDCITPNCLRYIADAGTRWAYHNGPYSLIRSVIEAATNTDYNAYTFQKLQSKTGMGGLWIRLDTKSIYFSKPRHMARFGLMLLNKGVWAGDTVIGDQSYLSQMLSPSQTLNSSYGYLWWLNGQDNYMLPIDRRVYAGWLAPDAPADLYAAMGKNAQILDVVPSQNLVVVRMGKAPSEDFVPVSFHNEMWQYISAVISPTTHTPKVHSDRIRLFPNPAKDQITIQSEVAIQKLLLRDLLGNIVQKSHTEQLDLGQLPEGMYVLTIHLNDGKLVTKRVFKR